MRGAWNVVGKREAFSLTLGFDLKLDSFVLRELQMEILDGLFKGLAW